VILGLSKLREMCLGSGLLYALSWAQSSSNQSLNFRTSDLD